MRVLHVAAASLSLAKFALPLMQALRGDGWEVEALGGFDGHEVDLREAGFAMHQWSMGHTFSPLVLNRARRELGDFARAHHYDVIHTHCSFGGIVGNAAARPHTRHLLYTQHGFFVHERLGRFARRAWLEIEKIGLRHAESVLCVSAAERQLAQSLGVGPASKFIAIPGAGVDTTRFALSDEERRAVRQELRDRWQVPAGTPVLLTVSRLSWDKGYAELIAAARQLKQDGVRFRLVAAGSGKDEAAIRAAIAQADLEQEFLLLGWCANPLGLYAAADLFLFASHREGLPIAPIEALASGLPVIASALPGCREELVEGKYGVLYPVGEASALATAVRALLQDETKQKQLAATGPRRAADFDLKRVVALQLDLYRHLEAER